MKKHRTMLLVLLVVLLAVPFSIARAQNTQGRWALGLHGGANVWVNDLNKRIPGPSGEVMLRFGISRGFSAGILAGYEELKAKQEPALADQPFSYLKLHAIPASLVGWFHLAPGKKFNPYLYLGVGAMIYQRKTSGNVFVYDNKFQSSIHIPVGIGFEAFTSKKVSVALDLGYRVMDDYTDARKYEKWDTYATAKAGLNFYMGTSDADDDDEDGLTNGEERNWVTNPLNADSDGDGLKDGDEVKRHKTNPLKTDTDGDGLSDGGELNKNKTDPNKTDTDEDGLSDGDEVQRYNTDPMKLDSDGDALADGDEVLKHKSDPMKVDTDGDGLSDWDEVKTFNTDPAKADTDADGLSDGDEVRTHKTDPLKVDTDGGGVNDGAEISRRSNPLDPKDDVTKETIILEKGKTVVLEGVNFQTGKATLTKDSEITLEKAFVAMVANPDVSVQIVGHTDNTGSRTTNEKLSFRRAESVKAWLVKKGIPGSRMTTAGRGPDEPIAENDTPEGRLMNRRIEFRVQK
ncbi:MAG: OmpA family protein [Bacteroidota bacterium]